jgi:hypothetical protein
MVLSLSTFLSCGLFDSPRCAYPVRHCANSVSATCRAVRACEEGVRSFSDQVSDRPHHAIVHPTSRVRSSAASLLIRSSRLVRLSVAKSGERAVAKQGRPDDATGSIRKGLAVVPAEVVIAVSLSGHAKLLRPTRVGGGGNCLAEGVTTPPASTFPPPPLAFTPATRLTTSPGNSASYGSSCLLAASSMGMVASRCPSISRSSISASVYGFRASRWMRFHSRAQSLGSNRLTKRNFSRNA